MELHGVPASPGHALGKAFVLRRRSLGPTREAIPPEHVELEQRRFTQARDVCAQRLLELVAKSQRDGRAAEATVLAAHVELLNDTELASEVAAQIANHLVPAECAVQSVLEELVTEMSDLEAEYARIRVKDVEDVLSILVRALTGELTGTRGAAEPVVLIGHDLTPADTAALDKAHLLAIVCEAGGTTSHVSIIARGLEVPAVVGVHDATRAIRDGDLVIVNGCDGRVWVRPSQREIAEHEQAKSWYEEDQRRLLAASVLPAVTKDGHAVSLGANIGTSAEVEQAVRYGAEGVGLLRSEFLFLGRETMPSEEEQFEAYRAVAARMEGKPVVVRTLDVGGDKPLSYVPMPLEANPFLGKRSVRLYGDWPDLVRAQFRAIVRASHFGAIHVLFPMITAVEEIVELLGLLNEARSSLHREGVPVDSGLPVGIMIETPAAAVIADRLIEHVDFFSIGTNDLTQYTLAVDRSNDGVAGLFDSFHPAVLRLIKTTVDASHAVGKWTGACGEMAGDPLATALLVGLGVDELSMSPARLPAAKQALRGRTLEEARALAQAALAANTAREVRALLKEGPGEAEK